MITFYPYFEGFTQKRDNNWHGRKRKTVLIRRKVLPLGQLALFGCTKKIKEGETIKRHPHILISHWILWVADDHMKREDHKVCHTWRLIPRLIKNPFEKVREIQKRKF